MVIVKRGINNLFIIVLQDGNFNREIIDLQMMWIISNTIMPTVRLSDRLMVFMKKWDSLLNDICNDFLIGDCDVVCNSICRCVKTL